MPGAYRLVRNRSSSRRAWERRRGSDAARRTCSTVRRPCGLRVNSLMRWMTDAISLSCGRLAHWSSFTYPAGARLFRDGAAGIEYPVAGWGYSEVGEVTEVSPELVGTPGMPVTGCSKVTAVSQ